MKATLSIIILAGLGLVGCSSSAETSVTKEQEANFRNPPKEIPPEIAERMRKSRDEANQKAQEGRQKVQQGQTGGQ